jgi:glutaminyl-peptide cyclotransferase
MNLSRNKSLLLTLVLAIGMISCQTSANSPAKEVPRYGYSIVNVYGHDTKAFTQGLEFHDGKLLESTGETGHSSLRRVALETGDILQRVTVPAPYFGEGITLLNGRIYQLTWQHQLGFIYDYNSFQKVGEFRYNGEGWGLTNDGQSLILTDGTNRIRFLDPENFRVTKTISVLDGKRPINDLNEVEYVNGEIYANIWHQNLIATIDPQSGRVTAWIDLNGLLRAGEVTEEEAVLNGIASDAATGRLFVTGKLWPKLFEIKIKK